MAETIKFQSGESIELCQRADSMWFAQAQDRHFLAQTKQGLIEALKSLGPIITPQVVEMPPELSPLDTYVSIINSDLSLSSKQEAWTRLKGLAGSDESAKRIVDAVLAQSLSTAAKEITRTLGKTDFLEVSYADLVKYVNDLVLRSRLVMELAGRFRIDLAARFSDARRTGTVDLERKTK